MSYRAVYCPFDARVDQYPISGKALCQSARQMFTLFDARIGGPLGRLREGESSAIVPGHAGRLV